MYVLPSYYLFPLPLRRFLLRRASIAAKLVLEVPRAPSRAVDGRDRQISDTRVPHVEKISRGIAVWVPVTGEKQGHQHQLINISSEEGEKKPGEMEERRV